MERNYHFVTVVVVQPFYKATERIVILVLLVGGDTRIYC